MIRDRRRSEMLVRVRDESVPACLVPVRTEPHVRGVADPRPRPAGSCVRYAQCGNVASDDGLCASCAARFRLCCKRCGRSLTDSAIERGAGLCGKCFHDMPRHERNGYLHGRGR